MLDSSIATRTELPAGTELAGRYRVRGVLGRGGMGVVYEAEHIALERLVALKTVHSELIVEASALARFVREARAAASIGHPGIIQVFDLMADRGMTFLVMERLYGEDLRRRIARTGALTTANVVAIGIALCDAIAAAHVRGVLHRDLTPRNVFLSSDSLGQEILKVLDFGIAKVVEPQLHDLTTQSQQLIGTLMYMAPERFSADSEASPCIDIYAIGAILYEALSGAPPFVANNQPELALKIALESPLPLAARCTAPSELTAIIERALRKAPDERWPNALAMSEALRALKQVALPSDGSADSGAILTRPTQRAGQRTAPPPATVLQRVRIAGLASACAIASVLVAWQLRSESATNVEPTPAAPAATSTGLASIERPAPASLPAAPPSPQPLARDIAIDSVPGGALVRTEGGQQCTTPCRLGLRGDRALLRVRLRGFRSVTRHVTNPFPERVVFHLRPSKGADIEPLPPLLPR